jgi:hypothetical protein
LDIVPLSDKYVGIAFTVVNPAGRGAAAIASQELAVFDRTQGTLIARVDIAAQEKMLVTIAPGREPLEVLIVRHEPYPRVVRMALRGLQ